jgi:2-C-methyl-D-erythritol 2,4-cyclodiphosphate synthase
MFERFTESGRRVIFFARYYASQDRDTHIHCLHLLAGINQEAGGVLREAGLSLEAVEQLRSSEELFHRGTKRISTSVEMPFDQPARRAMVLASTAARKLGDGTVGPAHLLWAIFHADSKLKKKLLGMKLAEETLADLCRKYKGTAEQASRDLGLFEAVARRARSGIGYDLHRLEAGRKLILGGVEVPFERGLMGHSDGDVLSHAICDALLGAACLGDIGTHFPDTDAKWKGASSLVMLEHIGMLLNAAGWRIEHIDAVVIAEQPRLGPHFSAMRTALARALNILPDQVNLKAKTNEGVGALGRSEAIAAHAIATVAA